MDLKFIDSRDLYSLQNICQKGGGGKVLMLTFGTLWYLNVGQLIIIIYVLNFPFSICLIGVYSYQKFT